MNLSYISPFVVRQVMQQDDFEIFHRMDTASGHISPHSHDFYEIYFPRVEGVSYMVDGRRFRLSPGSLLLIAPGQVHYSDVAVPGLVVERFVLWVNPGFIDSLTGLLPRVRNLSAQDLQGRNLITPDAETYELMLGMLLSLLHEKQLNDMDSASLNRLVMAQLLIHISRAFSVGAGEFSRRNAQRYKEIMAVYDYISAHLKDELSIAALSEQFFMDKNTLTRQFKLVTGMTPAECIRRKRLDAAYMMITHGAGITESCHECGFSDYSAFYRAFRQTYGVSPRECAGSAGSGVKLEPPAQ